MRDGKRGVGWHPHRGFETVTLAWEGAVAHRDNAGHAGIIGPGDVQWMTAGGGIFHEEYHEEAFSRRGGHMHMMQLWVNLPRKDKTAAPAYQPITAAADPARRAARRRGRGARDRRRATATRAGPPTRSRRCRCSTSAWRRAAGCPSSCRAATTRWRSWSRGACTPAARRRSAGELLLFAHDGERLELIADEESHILILAGEPIDEPIVQYGPFVMNSLDEIRQAITDVNAGRFGPIPD